MNSLYFAAIINSTFRYATPVLFAALGSLLCSRGNVFNVALEGQMLAAAFAAIVINFYTKNMVLSILAAICAGLLVSSVVALFQIKLKAHDMVVGTTINLFIQSATAFLMQIVFGSRGMVQGHGMVSLTKIDLNFLSWSPFLYRAFENLSILDYASYIIAIIVYVYLFKTVRGFHLRSVGIRYNAAKSLGINSQKMQMNVVLISGILCGLGGVSLCMGGVTVFVENMTAGRGFIAMGASSMAQAHPIMAIFSSLFFGATISLSKTLQKIINSYFTETFPYICTILAITIYGAVSKAKKKK